MSSGEDQVGFELLPCYDAGNRRTGPTACLEMVGEVPEVDEQNARVEVVDLFHFLISLAQVLGMSAEDVFNAYCKKERSELQTAGKRVAVKDEADSKHI